MDRKIGMFVVLTAAFTMFLLPGVWAAGDMGPIV